MPLANISFSSQPVWVGCDGQCNKAWGISDREREQMSADEEDYALLADDELGEAPALSSWWEDTDNKPVSVALFPNKWCVRACERCVMFNNRQDLELPDFSRRLYNMPWLHPNG